MLSALPGGGSEEIMLRCQKPVVVLIAPILSEGVEIGFEESDIRPFEEGHKGTILEEAGDETQHEFNTVGEAMEFVKGR